MFQRQNRIASATITFKLNAAAADRLKASRTGFVTGPKAGCDHGRTHRRVLFLENGRVFVEIPQVMTDPEPIPSRSGRIADSFHAEILHGGRLTNAMDAAPRPPIGQLSSSLDRRIRRPRLLGVSPHLTSGEAFRRFTQSRWAAACSAAVSEFQEGFSYVTSGFSAKLLRSGRHICR